MKKNVIECYSFLAIAKQIDSDAICKPVFNKVVKQIKPTLTEYEEQCEEIRFELSATKEIDGTVCVARTEDGNYIFSKENELELRKRVKNLMFETSVIVTPQILNLKNLPLKLQTPEIHEILDGFINFIDE